MERILLLYNSGAGSTKTIAGIYYHLLSDYQVDILSVTLSFDYNVIENYDMVIFGFPNYHCSLSRLMKEFMDNMPPRPQKIKAFAFTTYGLYTGNLLRKFVRQCREKNIYVGDCAGYKSPATDGSLIFPPFAFMYKYEKKIGRHIVCDMEKIKRILHSEGYKSKIPRFKLYAILNYPNEIGGKMLRREIKIRKDVCTNCNLCVRQCPRECWKAGCEHPVFDKLRCDTCYRCIHQCPQEALVFSRKTIKKRKLNTRFYKEWRESILEEINIEQYNRHAK